MSILLKILALLSTLQSNKLVQEVEQCVLTNSTPQAIWQCVLTKLGSAGLQPGTPDHAVAECAKTLAADAKL